MIDTIVLRIHNISDYPQIKAQYYAPAQKKNTSTRAIFDDETGEFFREVHYSPAMVFHDTNRIIRPVYRSSLHIASSHYDLVYCYNEEKNFLEFNFSIPKFKYGTNVVQFINQYDTSATGCYNELIIFLRKFVREQLIQTPALYDIEINRIDLCYNQFFNSKGDALLYLDEQKKLLAKYARSSKNNKHSYDTSWVYVTRRYSFKCYHKGTEFEKHDMKKLMKSNPLNYDIPYLKEQADRILRYEMTARSSFINYLFRQAFFESSIKGKSMIYADHIVSKTWNKFFTFFREDKIASNKNSVYENYMRTAKFFTLTSVYDELTFEQLMFSMKDHNTHIYRKNNREFNMLDTVTFDKVLFSSLHNFFWTLFDKYQLEHTTDLNVLKDKIKKLEADRLWRKKNGVKSNYRYSRGLDASKMLLCAMVINNGGKIESLKNYVPHTTFFRIKHELKSLGITDNLSDVSIPKPRRDYVDYLLYFAKYHFYGT